MKKKNEMTEKNLARLFHEEKKENRERENRNILVFFTIAIILMLIVSLSIVDNYKSKIETLKESLNAEIGWLYAENDRISNKNYWTNEEIHYIKMCESSGKVWALNKTHTGAEVRGVLQISYGLFHDEVYRDYGFQPTEEQYKDAVVDEYVSEKFLQRISKRDVEYPIFSATLEKDLLPANNSSVFICFSFIVLFVCLGCLIRCLFLLLLYPDNLN